jgi:hypothetical protein
MGREELYATVLRSGAMVLDKEGGCKKSGGKPHARCCLVNHNNSPLPCFS